MSRNYAAPCRHLACRCETPRARHAGTMRYAHVVRHSIAIKLVFLDLVISLNGWQRRAGEGGWGESEKTL